MQKFKQILVFAVLSGCGVGQDAVLRGDEI